LFISLLVLTFESSSGTRGLSGDVREGPASDWFYSIFSVKIAKWNPGSSTRIHRRHHQNDGVFDGAGEPFGAGTIMALNHIQITNAKPKDKASLYPRVLG
jgi:hypothetical protein